MKRKRKRGEKREAQSLLWSQPTGVIGTKPPPEQRYYKGKTLLEALLWTALFVFLLIAITILEIALR